MGGINQPVKKTSKLSLVHTVCQFLSSLYFNSGYMECCRRLEKGNSILAFVIGGLAGATCQGIAIFILPAGNCMIVHIEFRGVKTWGQGLPHLLAIVWDFLL